MINTIIIPICIIREISVIGIIRDVCMRQSGGPTDRNVLLPVEGIEVNECLLDRKGKDRNQRHLAYSES